jgi:hypothetical protein
MAAPTMQGKLQLVATSTLEKLELLAARVRGRDQGPSLYLDTVPWQVCCGYRG